MPRSQLSSLAKVVLQLHEKSPDARIKVRAADGTYIEVDGREIREAIKNGQDRPVIIDKLAFTEAYKYLENARSRLGTKTHEGYSNCKADCRNALMSALKTLTGKDTITEATKELHRRGILGEREEEFTKTFDKLLGILHGIDSKKGSHPPMTRNANDAELALNLTQSIMNYIISQAVKQR
jgi:hypothetical protein